MPPTTLNSEEPLIPAICNSHSPQSNFSTTFKNHLPGITVKNIKKQCIQTN